MKTTTLKSAGIRRKLLACVAIGALAAGPIAPAAGQNAPAFAGGKDDATASPIKHVIIIIGENRSFDHVFATYKPVNKNEKVLNLLSQGIVRDDGSPGQNYGSALQYNAHDHDTYKITPPKAPYATLPPALVGGTSTPYACQFLGITTGTSCVSAANIAKVKAVENGLADDYYQYLLTGGTGQTNKMPDMRVHYDGQDASHLPPGPYQLTNSVNPNNPYPYDAYAASPVHRFFQMQQQLDCDAAAADNKNGWGCFSDLYPWVEETVGAGSNGAAPPSPFTAESTGEGSTAMGFYNVQNGDVPYLKSLADEYSMSDNYHQGIKGGTGANHIVMGTADAIFFSNGAGSPQEPPHYSVNPTDPTVPAPGNPSSLSEIENPNPQPGTNNYYTQDGYGGGTTFSPGASTNYGGGSYVNCGDTKQPGVEPEVKYLNALPNKVNPNCDANHYYLVNNYNPGYFGDGKNAYTDTNPNNYVYTIPPSSVKNIGDVMTEHSVSWAYFGDQWNEYLKDPYDLSPTDEYCNICNWATYSTSIMTNPAERTAHLKDTTDLYAGLASGDLPAVSFVKPSGLVDGHPASSKLILFEGFVKKIVDDLKANPKLWKNTAILITFDEGGGYWDSGYVQPVDFFGDGTRIPMIAVSPFSKGGHISHTYTDHASPAKFIERNWGLTPITSRSRDNLPNPLMDRNPYVPVNSPAIGDLWDLFDFDR
jgi:phospholipase C